jgi:MoxR-like ATPase
MAERQVSVGKTTYPLPELFLVMATQNPIEQEGTYPLPEAQLDRFLMHVRVDYPNVDAERKILQLVRNESINNAEVIPAPAPIPEQTIFAARQQVLALHSAPAVEEYIVQLVMASRQPANYSSDLAAWIEFGASPRGTIALDSCARAHAWINGRDFVSPDDVQAIAADVLRHRLILSFEAEANGITADHVVEELLRQVPVA